jgi:hypothetical protein
MFRLATAYWFALAAPVVMAAQQSDPTSPAATTAAQSVHTPRPVVVSDPADLGAPPADNPPLPGEAHVMGSPSVFVQSNLDDSVPLPNPPKRALVGGVDTELEPASGNPDYLGFAAGKYYPPAGEKIDPLLVQSIQAQYTDGRPTQETYAFVMFSKRITDARRAELAQLGVRVIEFHPFYTLKVALAPMLIDQVAALDFVRWVGAPRSYQKLHPDLAAAIGQTNDGQRVDVYISIFDSDKNPASQELTIARPEIVGPDGDRRVLADGRAATKWMSNGWQQKALQALGVEVSEYCDGIRAFRAKISPSSLEQLTALDFVQFIEADLPPALMTAPGPEPAPAPAPAPHDESTPLINTDWMRGYYNGGTTTTAVGGQADSGYDSTHVDLALYAVGWDFAGTAGAFTDGCEHGSHVSGTIRGHGSANASMKGNAPGLGFSGAGRFFDAKIFNDTCGYGGASLTSIMNVLNTSFNDGTNTTPRPNVINHSWGTSGGGPYFGTEADARTIDNEVNGNAQLHIWAAGNGGSTSSTLNLQASAKNAFVVGSVVDYPSAAYGDPGSLYNNASDGSSVGPAADGRWKPNVCAPGRWIRSVDANSTNGYKDLYGTSMATPHVTGLGAELVDHYHYLSGWPEPLAALMMASATTKDNVALTYPTDTHLRTYGTGRVEAYRAHYPSSQLGWYLWFYGIGNSSTYGDFDVNAGATRVVVCMFYSEPAASAGASQALVNDFDLYIDQPPVDTANNNTGDWFLQQSSIDNCEIRIIDNPTTGTWRWKQWNQNVPGSVYTGVAVQVIYGDTTPDGSLTVAANDVYVQPNDDVSITATAYNPEFIASAVVLDSSSSGDSLQSASTTLFDGPVTNLLTNQSFGRDITLGDIAGGLSRSATWVTRWPTEGVKSWCVNARSDNWVDKNACVNVTVDGTPPALVGNLHSTSHTLNVWSNDPTIDFAWNPATDNLSGVQGYGVSWGNSPGVFVADALDTTTTNYTTFSLSTNASWYFAVKTVDNCDNWTGPTSEVGPYKIDVIAPVGPTGLFSSDHSPGVQSCNTTVTMQWTAGSDANSGLAGYVGVWDTAPLTDPVGAVNIAAGATSFAQNLGSSTSARYFHLRAKDVAGNYGTTRHSGGMLVNSASVATYCTAKTNSLGCLPTIGTNGVQPDKSAGAFTVLCTNVLNQKNGLMFWGRGQIAVPFQGGTLCVMAPTVRTLNVGSGGAGTGNSCTGSYSFNFSTAYMNANAINIGDTIYCQWWMRDPASPSTTGLSNAVRFTVCE